MRRPLDSLIRNRTTSDRMMVRGENNPFETHSYVIPYHVVICCGIFSHVAVSRAITPRRVILHRTNSYGITSVRILPCGIAGSGIAGYRIVDCGIAAYRTLGSRIAGSRIVDCEIVACGIAGVPR